MRNLSRRLSRAVNRIDEAYLVGTRQEPVSGNEICFMYAVDDGQNHTQTEICREWMIPKTTLNTIVKRWERNEWLSLRHVPGQRREREICLTDSGRRHVEEQLRPFYQAEEQAMKETLERFDPSFIEALEVYGACLQVAFQEREGADQT